jgi:hypothetical protein
VEALRFCKRETEFQTVNVTYWPNSYQSNTSDMKTQPSGAQTLSFTSVRSQFARAPSSLLCLHALLFLLLPFFFFSILLFFGNILSVIRQMKPYEYNRFFHSIYLLISWLSSSLMISLISKFLTLPILHTRADFRNSILVANSLFTSFVGTCHTSGSYFKILLISSSYVSIFRIFVP